uniref:DUF4939 domain-containing protein n=1 Tax=Pygocentrus nattereri TaxID=42514 RepID=A0AAR2LYX5_PYGNA
EATIVVIKRAKTLLNATSGHFFPICKPEPYDGNPNKCSGFILQCSVYFSNSPPSTDQSKIAFIISCLTGKALDWATASWSFLQTLSYSDFLCQLPAGSGWNEPALL